MTSRRLLLACLALFAAQTIAPPARALCGFYAGSSGTPLLSSASKVVLAHHDGRTVLTMVSNYQGALEEFALVVPVPEVLEPGQIHIAEHALVDRLDAYTAPRLVERSDRNPCSAQASAGTTGTPPAETAVHGAGSRRSSRPASTTSPSSPRSRAPGSPAGCVRTATACPMAPRRHFSPTSKPACASFSPG
jgi:hypothetical protein